ncbi:MAG TPA: MFS transporter [Anaerolineae bacterium]|nr:MFS transporter [Anaerolineae bacterium]
MGASSEGAIAKTAVARREQIPLVALYTANAISMVGNVLMVLAVPWFVLQTTGSAEKTGVTGFFEALPIALAAFLGGTVVDRVGYKRSSIIADLGGGVTVALIPILYAMGALEFSTLLALVFLGNLLDAPGSTARDAIVPDLAARAGVSLERASSLNQIVERSSRLIGAPLAGVLIAAVGATSVLWIDAASFFVSAIIVTLFVTNVVHKREEEAARGLHAQFLDGLNFIRREPVLRVIVLVVMVTNMLDNGVLFTIYVQQVFGNAVGLGISVAAIGGGAVVGALIFSAIGQRLPRGITFIGLFVLVGLRFFAYALYPPFPVLIAIQLLAGLASGPLNPLISTVSYERIPADMRGRVFGALTGGAMVALPLGALFSGIAVERVGLTATLVATSAVYVVVTGAMWFTAARKDMDRRVTLPASP